MDGTGGNQMGRQRRLWGIEGEWGRVWHAPHPSSSAPPPSNPRRHGDQSVVPSCIFDDGRTRQGAGATSGAEQRHRHRVLLASRLDLTIGSGHMGRHLGCFLAAIWTAKFFSFLTFTPLSDKTGCRPQRLPGGLEKSPPSYRERLFVICPRLSNPQKREVPDFRKQSETISGMFWILRSQIVCKKCHQSGRKSNKKNNNLEILRILDRNQCLCTGAPLTGRQLSQTKQCNDKNVGQWNCEKKHRAPCNKKHPEKGNKLQGWR